MIAANTVQLVVVTPEKTLLTQEATSLQFPLEDGQIGILPGRAPMVGRLGIGELVVINGSEKTSYFIDGGFVQVKGGAVTLLTNHAEPVINLKVKEIEAAFNEALERPATTATAQAAKQHDIERNRRLLAILNR